MSTRRSTIFPAEEISFAEFEDISQLSHSAADRHARRWRRIQEEKHLRTLTSGSKRPAGKTTRTRHEEQRKPQGDGIASGNFLSRKLSLEGARHFICGPVGARGGAGGGQVFARGPGVLPGLEARGVVEGEGELGRDPTDADPKHAMLRRQGRVEGCSGGVVLGALIGGGIAALVMSTAGVCFQ